MSVRIIIDRLVLDGLNLAPAERAKLVAAVQTEVACHVAQQGLATAFGSGLAVHRLGAPHMTLPHGASGTELGARIASALSESLSEAGR